MIIKKIDGVGRIVVPVELRNVLGWKEGDALILETNEDALIVRKKTEAKCKLCGSTDNLHKINHSWICGDCISEIQKVG